jgi:hypothetical protein
VRRGNHSVGEVVEFAPASSSVPECGQILNKLQSPNLEKALTFLDDKLLPSTSNAVERGYRRYRKIQKTVYRVRTKENVQNRITLDMVRDAQQESQKETAESLHQKRGGK